jgi:hypothetical protein
MILLTEILNELKYSDDKDWWVTIDPKEFKGVNSKSKIYKLLKSFVKERNTNKYKLTIDEEDFNKGINRVIKLITSGKYELKAIATNPANNDSTKIFDITIQLRNIDKGFTAQMGNDKNLD